MDRQLHTQLEKRLGLMRRNILALGRFGLSSSHYERELAMLENQARLAREELERARKWGTLFDAETETKITA